MDCIVIGGGLRGLSAAHAARKAGASVLLLDGGSSLGGKEAAALLTSRPRFGSNSALLELGQQRDTVASAGAEERAEAGCAQPGAGQQAPAGAARQLAAELGADRPGSAAALVCALADALPSSAVVLGRRGSVLSIRLFDSIAVVGTTDKSEFGGAWHSSLCLHPAHCAHQLLTDACSFCRSLRGHHGGSSRGGELSSVSPGAPE